MVTLKVVIGRTEERAYVDSRNDSDTKKLARS
jgi:hypothetical protein